MNEIWKPIPNYATYEISSLGRVRNVKTGRTKKAVIGSGGYPTVQLYGDKSRTTVRIHRLVAKSFIQNPDDLPQVNHKDFNKENNEVLNLEWVTAQQNIRHFYRNGDTRDLSRRDYRGDGNPQSILTEKQVLWIRRLANSYSQYELSEIFNIGVTQIRNIIKRKSWNHI